MDYLSRNEKLRQDTSNILPGAKSVIVTAFSYGDDKSVRPKLPIASYALGADYHYVLKNRLAPIVAQLKEAGEDARICVDSAPLAERYWAVRAGLGKIGLNCQLYVPGAGCKVLLASILTTAALQATSAGKTEYIRPVCRECRRCISACPAGALNGDGTLDARRCLNYLTIEHKGDFEESTDLHGRFFGCDCCSDVCPVTCSSLPETIEELRPDERIINLSEDSLRSMSSSSFNRHFRFSPISRPGLKGLLRNLDTYKKQCKA